MGLDGVRPLGESYEDAVQVHEQCQEAARGGFSPQKKELGRGSCWEMRGLHQQGCIPSTTEQYQFRPRAQTVGQR